MFWGFRAVYAALSKKCVTHTVHFILAQYRFNVVMDDVCRKAVLVTHVTRLRR